MTDEKNDAPSPTEPPSDEKPAADAAEEEPKSPLQEIIQPFIDLIHAPRALWGINLAYFLEGWCYFGMLTYMVMFFNDYVGLDDVDAGIMVGFLTAGITISMFLFGGVSDKIGVRRALVIAFLMLLGGRVLLSLGPTLGFGADGMWSSVHLFAMGGILLVVLGYGLYQPSAYSAVRQFTSEKTAAMGFAMLYALMNLGGFMPTFFPPIRKAIGISGCFWVYAGLTVLALVITAVILTRKTVANAIANAKEENAALKAEKEAKKEGGEENTKKEPAAAPVEESATRIAAHLWGVWVVAAGLLLYFIPESWGMPWRLLPGIAVVLFPVVVMVLPAGPRGSITRWFANHPLGDAKFFFFIFALIPVQTLFAHNWMTLPIYAKRALHGTWWSDNFEVAIGFNPLLIFILVPIVTAMTRHANVYRMMIIGTFIMAAPTFLLALGANPWMFGGYIIVMTFGEAMWQPRFLQYAAEIAPEGRTGAYMGVAQFPWFLTKLIVPLYSGYFIANYCPDPETGAQLTTEKMWFIYACIAMCSTVFLILAKGWVGKDFKTKA